MITGYTTGDFIFKGVHKIVWSDIGRVGCNREIRAEIQQNNTAQTHGGGVGIGVAVVLIVNVGFFCAKKNRCKLQKKKQQTVVVRTLCMIRGRKQKRKIFLSVFFNVKVAFATHKKGFAFKRTLEFCCFFSLFELVAFWGHFLVCVCVCEKENNVQWIFP